MWHSHSAWFWWWMVPVMLGFWALVGFVIVRRSGGPGRDTSDAQELLDERLARGEIDEDEYRRRRDLIRH